MENLTTIWIELHSWPTHEFLLLDQGPFPEILVKKCSELVDLKNCLFLKQQNFKKLKFFCPIPAQLSHKFLDSMNLIQFLWLCWFPAKYQVVCKNMRHPVCIVIHCKKKWIWLKFFEGISMWFKGLFSLLQDAILIKMRYIVSNKGRGVDF